MQYKLLLLWYLVVLNLGLQHSSTIEDPQSLLTELRKAPESGQMGFL